MKLIQPLVEKVKATYDEIKALSNDQLRAKTKEIQAYVQNAAKEQKEKIAELKAQIEETPIDERESLFNQIDKLEKEALEVYEVALNEVMPVAFGIMHDTARRFTENEEIVVTATDFDRDFGRHQRLRAHRRRQCHIFQPLDCWRKRHQVGHDSLRRANLRRYCPAPRKDCRDGNG